MDWEYLHSIVMAKLNALTLEDEKSSLVPFMLAAKKCSNENDDGMLGSLSIAYELLCLQPDVSKEYDEFNMRKRLRDESRVHVIRVVIKMLNVCEEHDAYTCNVMLKKLSCFTLKSKFDIIYTCVHI